MLKIEELIRLDDKSPPINEIVLFVWWHRNGIVTSSKTLGYMNNNGDLKLDMLLARNRKPTFWCRLFEK